MPKEKVLLVDADGCDARLLEVSLKRVGYDVTPVKDGVEALAHVSASRPDILVADTNLPELDGYRLVQRLREDPAWAGIPVVFLGRDGSVEQRIRALRVGVEDYLTKPVFVPELLGRMAILLARRKRGGFAAETRCTAMHLSGSIHDMTVVDLVQTFELARKSGTVTLSDGRRIASIFLRDGKIVDADLGGLRGERAVYRTLVWHDASFEAVFGPVDNEDVVAMSTQAVLMEGLRRADEWGLLLEQLPPLTTVGDASMAALLSRLDEIPDEANGILRLVDGRRSLLEIVEQSPFEDLHTLSVLCGLYFDGVIVAAEGAGGEREALATDAPAEIVLAPHATLRTRGRRRSGNVPDSSRSSRCPPSRRVGPPSSARRRPAALPAEMQLPRQATPTSRTAETTNGPDVGSSSVMEMDSQDPAISTHSRSDAPVALDAEADASAEWPYEAAAARRSRRGGPLVGLAAAIALLGIVVAARLWKSDARAVSASTVTALAAEAIRVDARSPDPVVAPDPGERPMADPPSETRTPAAIPATLALAVSPDSPSVPAPAPNTTELADEARRALERGNTARAEDLAIKATDSDPTNATAWLTLGAAFYMENHRAKEHWAFQRCVESGRGPRVAECRALLR